MGSKKKADPAPRQRGMKVSHKRRVALVQDIQAMKQDLDRLETRLQISDRMLKEDYWAVSDKIFLDLFKERLKR